MIGLPQELRPSMLLWDGELDPRATSIVEDCHHFALATAPRPLALLVRDAEELCAQVDQNTCAIILLHLADLYLGLNRLGPALEYAQRAEQNICCWPIQRHVHNHAVALYCLGLVQQLLGFEGRTFDTYATALEKFTQAIQQWQLDSEETWKKKCVAIVQLIENLRGCMTRQRRQGRIPTTDCSILSGFWLTPGDLFDANTFPFTEVKVETVVTAMYLHLENEIHQLRLLNGGGTRCITIEPGRQYYILEKSQEWDETPSELSKGSHVLLCCEQNRHECQFDDLPGDVGESYAYEFDRDELTGEITLYAVQLPQVRILGLEQSPEDALGTVIGVFEPREAA